VPPPRGSMPSMQAVRPSQMGMQAVRPSQMGMPAVRPSQMSMAAVRPEIGEEASEADLPTHDGAPISQPMPSSGPRSVRGAPISTRQPAGPVSSRPSRPEEPPASARGPSEVSMRAELSREQASAVSEVADVIKSRFRAPGILLVAAIGITLIDLAFVRVAGGPLSLGPVRALWIAGPLAIVGAILLVWKIVSDD